MPELTRPISDRTAWKRFAGLFIGTFVTALVVIYAFVLLLDPYGVVPFSLPVERRLVSISQRHMYPQIVKSRRFDSLVIGTSTSRLLDPMILNEVFQARVANLAMDDASAWEQQTVAHYFIDQVGPPKVLIIGMDRVWCEPAANRNMRRADFPEWIYDRNPWNDFLYLLNKSTVEIAGRLVGYHLGLYPERARYDGFQVFVPPENEYDLARAQQHIWRGRSPAGTTEARPFELSAAERQALSFPALSWLDAVLSRVPDAHLKVLAYMPVHVAEQPQAGTREAAVEQECKNRVAEIAGHRGARVVDWRIPSGLTKNDQNYWDGLHFRLPVANMIARELAAAVLQGRDSTDGSYKIVR